jgi:hypothetical protein
MSFLAKEINIKKLNNRKIHVRVVINSFSGNAMESHYSTLALDLLKQKNIIIDDVTDINQELIFESDKSKIFINIRTEGRDKRALS